MNVGKCPKCEATLSSVNIEHVDVSQNFQSRWHGVSYTCPHCRTILSVSIDPISLKADIVKEVAAALRTFRP